jgi:ABC-type polysaccharide/polyol phosphate export permease
MTSAPLLHPLRPIQRRHLVLMRQVASLQHSLLDQSTGLGYLWSFLHPLLMLAVLWAFFSHRVGQGVPHYPIYLLIGLVQFTHFSKSLSSAMRVLHQMRSLAVNVIFPKDVLVYSALLANLPEFLISMALTVILAFVSGVPPTAAMLALPLVLLLHLSLVLWASLFLSMTFVFVRDLDHLFEVGMRILFFITPVFFSLDILPPRVRQMALLNPLAHAIGYTRTLLLDGRLPSLEQLAAFGAINLALGYVALIAFRRAEPALLERLL